MVLYTFEMNQNEVVAPMTFIGNNLRTRSTQNYPKICNGLFSKLLITLSSSPYQVKMPLRCSPQHDTTLLGRTKTRLFTQHASLFFIHLQPISSVSCRFWKHPTGAAHRRDLHCSHGPTQEPGSQELCKQTHS